MSAEPEYNGVAFYRNDVEHNPDTFTVCRVAELIDRYKEAFASGQIVSSVVLCEDGSAILYSHANTDEYETVEISVEDRQLELALEKEDT